MSVKIFEVQYSTQPKDREKWRRNRIAFVATQGDAGEAIGLVRELDPDAEVWQCIHRSNTGSVIVDPRIIAS